MPAMQACRSAGRERTSHATAAPCPWLEGHGLANPTDSGWADVLFFLLVLVGWSIMVLALLPGARFWFDLLAKMGSLRSTGPKPPLTT